MVNFNPNKFGGSAFAGRPTSPAATPVNQVQAQTETIVNHMAMEVPPSPDVRCSPGADGEVESHNNDSEAQTVEFDPRQGTLEGMTPAAQAAPANPATTALTARPNVMPAIVQLAGTEIDAGEWLADDDGLGDLQRLGTSLPSVYLAYESSPQVKEAGLKAGLWTHSATGQQKDTLNVVMVGFLQQRALRQKYEPKADEQAPAICVSTDGNTGSGSYVTDEDIADDRKVTILANEVPHSGRFGIEAGQVCARCVFTTWAGSGKSRTKPACAEVYALVMHEAEWGPIVVRLKSTAIKPLRQWRDAWWPRVNTIAMQWTREHGGARVPAKLLAQVSIGTKAVDRYFVPTFADAGVTSDERLAFVLSMKDLFDDIQSRLQSTESFDEGDEHVIDGDDGVPFGNTENTHAHGGQRTNGGSGFTQRANGSAFANRGR